MSGYKHERDYHQLFIDSIDEFPDELKSKPGLRMMVWAHELSLHAAGKNGGWGSIDLMAVDELGLVWAIEAKTFGNTELAATIWGNQIRRYQMGLMNTPWEDLHHYAVKFLMGKEKMIAGTRPFWGAQSLEQVFHIWQTKIGRALISPAELKNRVAASLAQGTFGMMVLADKHVEPVSKAAESFEHNGPIAFVVGYDPDDSGMQMFPRYSRRAKETAGKVILTPQANESTFAEYEKKQRAFFASSLDGFLHQVCPMFRALWSEFLEKEMTDIGWQRVDKEHNNGSSILLHFRIGDDLVPLVRLAWVDSTRRGGLVPSEFTNRGNYAVKVDFYVNRIKDRPYGTEEFVRPFAQRLQACNYVPMGTGRSMLDRKLTPSEFEKWNGCIERTPEYFRNDKSEQRDIRAFCQLLKSFLEDARELVGS